MEMEMKDELQAQIERLAGAAETLERLVAQQSCAGRGWRGVDRAHRGDGGRDGREQARGGVAGAVGGGGADDRRAARFCSCCGYTSESQDAAGGPAGQAGERGGSIDTAALDAALVSLSLEQRIAVKAQLLRAGLV